MIDPNELAEQRSSPPEPDWQPGSSQIKNSEYSLEALATLGPLFTLIPKIDWTNSLTLDALFGKPDVRPAEVSNLIKSLSALAHQERGKGVSQSNKPDNSRESNKYIDKNERHKAITEYRLDRWIEQIDYNAANAHAASKLAKETPKQVLLALMNALLIQENSGQKESLSPDTELTSHDYETNFPISRSPGTLKPDEPASDHNA